VFGFDVLILEVMCGRPIEEGKAPLVDWAWQLMLQGQLLNALDERLKARREFGEEEVGRVLPLGLLCAYLDPSSRPTMRQVVKALEGKREDMDAYFLQRMKSMRKLSEIPRNFGCSSHPTFEDIRHPTLLHVSLLVQYYVGGQVNPHHEWTLIENNLFY
jgi:hypothetical protein